MKEKIKLVKCCFSQMNRISALYVKIGSVAVVTALLLTVFCSLCLGRFGNYDELLFLRNELFCLFKEMSAAVYIPALLVEIAYRALKFDGYIN